MRMQLLSMFLLGAGLALLAIRLFPNQFGVTIGSGLLATWIPGMVVVIGILLSFGSRLISEGSDA